MRGSSRIASMPAPTMWIFLESTIDFLVEPLDEKPGDFSRFLIGRGLPGCGCLRYHPRIAWGAHQ